MTSGVVKSRPSGKTVVAIVVGVSLLLRSAGLMYAYGKSTSELERASHPFLVVAQDSTVYFKLALNFLQGRGLTADHLGRVDHDTPFRKTPVYAFVLMPLYNLFDLADTDVSRLYPENRAAKIVFEEHQPVVLTAAVLNHVLGILTILLAMAMVKFLSGSNWAALVCGILLTLSPVRILAATTLLPDALQVFLMTLSFWLFLVATSRECVRRLLLAALCIGLSSFTKPSSLYLWFLFVLGVGLFWKVRLPHRLFLMVCVTLFSNLLPAFWMLRNGMVSGEYRFTTEVDNVILQHRAQYALSEKLGLQIHEFLRSEARTNLDIEVGRRMNDAERGMGRKLSIVERDGISREIGLEIIRDNLYWYAKAHIKGIFIEFARAPSGRTRVVELALTFAMVALSGVAIYRNLVNRLYLPLLILVGPVFYFAFVAIPPSPAGITRYKALWLPFGCAFAALAIPTLQCFWADRIKPIRACKSPAEQP